MVKTRNTRSGGGHQAGHQGQAGDTAATLRPSTKKGRKRQLTESSSSSQASMLTASSALSPLPGGSSALVAPGVSQGYTSPPQESDWHLAPSNNNNTMEHINQPDQFLEADTDHDIVPVAGDLVIFSNRDTAAPVSLAPLTAGDETNSVAKEDGSDSLVLPDDLKQVGNVRRGHAVSCNVTSLEPGVSRLFPHLSPSHHAVQERSRHLQPLQAQGPVLPHVQRGGHRHQVLLGKL